MRADLRRNQPMVALTLAVAAGIVWDRYGPSQFFAGDSVHGSFWFAAWWCACAACLVAWLLTRRHRRDGFAAWILLVAAALAGSAWHELNWFLYNAHEIGRYAAFEPAPTCIEAIALESPERVSAPPATPLRAIPVGERSRLPIELTGVRDGARWRPASGVCQFSVEGHLLGVHQGDHLRIFGQLARISPQQNPGEFDFAAHARAARQIVRVRSKTPESVTTLEQGSWWTFSHFLDVARSSARQRVRSLIGPNHAGLAAAILLGASRRFALRSDRVLSRYGDGPCARRIRDERRDFGCRLVGDDALGLDAAASRSVSDHGGRCRIRVAGRSAAAGGSCGGVQRVDVCRGLVGQAWRGIQFDFCRGTARDCDQSKRFVRRGAAT